MKKVMYMGRPVDFSTFRAFVYGNDGASKVVERWQEFEECMASGVWFAEKKEVPVILKQKKGAKNDDRT